jgi:hypothetical protein
LLLDEPSEGLAPLVVESLLDNVKSEGVTILLAEQGVDLSLAPADRVYIPGGASQAAKAARADPADANYHGRIAVIETQTREPQFAMRMIFRRSRGGNRRADPRADRRAEGGGRSGSPAAARMGGSHQPLNDNSTAVARAMRDWYPARAIVSAKSSAS